MNLFDNAAEKVGILEKCVTDKMEDCLKNSYRTYIYVIIILPVRGCVSNTDQATLFIVEL